jgi:hypothetical protein
MNYHATYLSLRLNLSQSEKTQQTNLNHFQEHSVNLSKNKIKTFTRTKVKHFQ